MKAKYNKGQGGPGDKSAKEKQKNLTPEQKKKLKKFLADRKKLLYNKSLVEKEKLNMPHAGGSNWMAKKS